MRIRTANRRRERKARHATPVNIGSALEELAVGFVRLTIERHNAFYEGLDEALAAALDEAARSLGIEARKAPQ